MNKILIQKEKKVMKYINDLKDNIIFRGKQIKWRWIGHFLDKKTLGSCQENLIKTPLEGQQEI